MIQEKNLQKKYGSILFCDHEIENKDTGFLATSKIANNFTEFLEGLYTLEFDEYTFEDNDDKR